MTGYNPSNIAHFQISQNSDLLILAGTGFPGGTIFGAQVIAPLPVNFFSDGNYRPENSDFHGGRTWFILATMAHLQLAPGTLFANRFEIECTAGRGGMGTVYRAYDRYSGDVIALKLLHNEANEPSEADRFTREAQLLAELRHPAIVTYIAHGGTPDGQRFLAMEWLEGHDLGQRLARGPLWLHETMQVAQRTAEALTLAHRRGIVHREQYAPSRNSV